MISVALIAYLSNIVVTIFGQVGYLLQKKAHLNLEKTNSQSQIGYWFNPLWILGLIIVFATGAAHCAVLPFADLVLLSTNCAWAIVFGQILSVAVLKERFMWRYDLPALFLVITGCLTIVFNANYETISYSKEKIDKLLYNKLNLSIYILLTLVFLLSRVMDCYFQKFLNRFEKEAEEAIEKSNPTNEIYLLTDNMS